MPTTVTYPGVYIEEIPSGVRTIDGVATSITAFIGRASMGRVSTPVPVQSFAEYGRVYGGLWTKSSMGFAVRGFFFNGGQQAIIIRVHNGAKPATFRIPTGGRGQVLQLEAANPGVWGNEIHVQAGRYPNESAIFRFTAEEIDPDMGLTVHGETYEEVSINPDHPRFLPMVLERESSLVKAVTVKGKPVMPTTIPISSTKLKHVASGTDGRTLTKAQILKGTHCARSMRPVQSALHPALPH